ncbi:MAG: hypothetical protein ACI8QZ_001074 [Chlamydiales bacterium]|jgi:hypothetical protein
MTLTEIMVSMMVMTVSVYILSTTITATIAHSAGKRERIKAVEAVRSLLEEMRSLPCGELFARYNDDPADDADGPGTAPGRHFSVLGLDSQKNDADGFVGEVIMSAVSAPLREDAVNSSLGLPRDLNGDALIDDADHAEDYILLPVHIRVEWSGHVGEREFEMFTMFADLRKWRS